MPRKVFVAGEILTAADVNTNLMDQAVMVFDSSAARGSAIPSPSEGMVTYLKDTDVLEIYTTAWGLFGGKILQVVRATDSTDRTTTSTSFVDANISVTITPKRSDSNVLIIWSSNAQPDGAGAATDARMNLQISDSSDVALSGAEDVQLGSTEDSFEYHAATLFGYSSPATTSSVTYKGRFRRADANTATAALTNSTTTGQLFAIEIGA